MLSDQAPFIARFIAYDQGVWLRKPKVFIKTPPEAGPEARDQTTPTYEPPSASRTPILIQVVTYHCKPTGSPQPIPQLTYCCRPLPTVMLTP